MGVVKNTHGRIIYEEHHNHKADSRGGVTQVEYKSRDGQLIAIKSLDYRCRPSAPNYSLTMMHRPQWIEQVNWQSDQLVITQPQSKEILADINPDTLVIDAGFNNFVFENWQQLVSGSEIAIDFLHVPGNRLFRLVINLESGKSEFELPEDTVLFKISTKNKLFRLFSEPIYLAYNKTTKQLEFYAGPTNLRGEIAGLQKSKQIFINYRYN